MTVDEKETIKHFGLKPFALEKLIEEKLKTIGAYPLRFIRESDRERDRLYASDLGKCERAVWLGWRVPKPHDEEFEHGRGALGHAVEEMHAKRVAPILVAREVSYTNTRVSGRVDFTLRIDGVQIPEEVKSTYAYSRMVNGPTYEHILQLGYYMLAMEAPYGILTYINLSNYGGQSGEETSLKVPWTPTLKRDLLTRIEHLWELVHSDIEPECENKDDPDGCFWCEIAEGRA